MTSTAITGPNGTTRGLFWGFAHPLGMSYKNRTLNTETSSYLRHDHNTKIASLQINDWLLFKLVTWDLNIAYNLIGLSKPSISSFS